MVFNTSFFSFFCFLFGACAVGACVCTLLFYYPLRFSHVWIIIIIHRTFHFSPHSSSFVTVNWRTNGTQLAFCARWLSASTSFIYWVYSTLTHFLFSENIYQRRLYVSAYVYDIVDLRYTTYPTRFRCNMPKHTIQLFVIEIQIFGFVEVVVMMFDYYWFHFIFRISIAKNLYAVQLTLFYRQLTMDRDEHTLTQS